MAQVLDFGISDLGARSVRSPLAFSSAMGDSIANFVEDDDRIRWNSGGRSDGDSGLLEKAGPRARIYFNPAHVHAGIVTCGGLCPGLNDVIRALVRCLWNRYGVRRVSGIRFGYKGLLPEYGLSVKALDPEIVDDIHKIGGTILGSSRGGGERTSEIVDAIERMNLNVLFAIGGDGTQKGALAISDELDRRGLKVSVVGIPKTIDNDLLFVDRSFGFETAVEKAADAVNAAHAEAHSSINGVGLVKLMGRDSGFIAAYASLANPVVNFCLIPELDFEMDGPTGLLAALERRFDSGKDHVVIVVAEGAGQRHIADEPERKDASGNILKKDIGEYLRQRITNHFKQAKREASVKYFDPSYTIRSVPAKGTDAIRCYMLARNAVHAAMAGRTNCVVGNQDDWYTLVPIRLATIERQKVNLSSDLWRAVLDATGQNIYFGTQANGNGKNGGVAP